jgi:hypothetical protein
LEHLGGTRVFSTAISEPADALCRSVLEAMKLMDGRIKEWSWK